MALSDSSDDGELKEGERVDEAVADVEILIVRGGSIASLSKFSAEGKEEEMDRKGFREERGEEFEGGEEEDRSLMPRKEIGA